MTTVNNASRADDAEKTLVAFVKTQYLGGNEPLEELNTDRGTYVGDLIANLLHYCDAHSLDFERLVERGTSHHYAETHGEE